MKKGFTLAEMLVVLAVLSLVGVLVVTIFTRSLRGANRAQIESAIKQNGQAVLELMDKTIREADNLVCVSSPSNNTVVIEKDGVYTRYRFNLDLTNRTNGSIIKDNPVPEPNVTDPRDFINSVCYSLNPMEMDFVTLSDTNKQTGVSLISGSFEKGLNTGGFKDIVTIKFVLGPGIKAPKVIAGQIDPVTFQTSVQLR